MDLLGAIFSLPNTGLGLHKNTRMAFSLGHCRRFSEGWVSLEAQF